MTRRNGEPTREIPDAASHMVELRSKLNLAHHGIGGLLERWSEMTTEEIKTRLALLHSETVVPAFMSSSTRLVPEREPEAQPGGKPTPAEVRRWCKEHGLSVTDVGAIPARARAAYDAAHPAAS